MEKQKLVIRVKDEFGSFFCGFEYDGTQIIKIKLSKSKENAVIYYGSNNDDATQDIIKIIQSSEGRLFASAQLFSAAPDIAE